MRLRTFGLLVTLALGILLAPLAADAQQTAKVARVGWLGSTPPTSPAVSHLSEAFRRGLRELGYVEGQNVVIERRYAEGRAERYPDLLRDLIQLKVDVIVSIATPATLAAKRVTSTIPIVMVGVGEPVRSGIVESLARPGGNITGVGGLGPELEGKRLEILKEALPKLSRVAVLINPDPGVHAVQLREAGVAARALGVTLQPLSVRGSDDLERAFSEMARGRADGFLAFRDPLTGQHGRQIVDLAAKHRLPGMYGFRDIVEAGGLMFYGEDLVASYRRAATYVDKILKGAKPADLPVEQPTRFELIINLKTAKALGLTIPQSVLIRADEVIHP